MQWHIEQAAAAGASYREILEAVEVAIEMGGGPATVSARFALDVLDSIKPEPDVDPAEAAQLGCPTGIK
jgi:alkylhydroperoxidase/carboxymuconolactone decarboxylase family protein YurZ